MIGLEVLVKTLRIVLPLLLVATLLGCSDLEETDNGGVFLSVEFQNVPGRIGVNDTDQVTIQTINIDSIVVNPSGGTSDLMNVQIDLYEVVFSRNDTGTRTPPSFIFRRAGVVPVDGTLTLNNFPIMSVEQMRSPPLADLLFENGGVDVETGSSAIKVNATFTVFGRTIGGQEVASTPRTETLEFVPSVLLTP